MGNSWDNITGHSWAVHLLIDAIVHERVGHAYLITGPEQIGKTMLARTFAQALNCQASIPGQRPCGQCRACTLIAADRHPDVRILNPEVSGRGKLTLKIDAVRSLQHELNLTAYEGNYKVGILRYFDAATIGASNAFLKTLEEPPNKVVLLLTAKDADTLLPTITSRCRTIGLRPLPTPLINDSLQSQWQVHTDQANLLAHLADGRLGWAVQASQEPELLEARQERLEQLHEVLAGSRVTRFALAEKLARKPEQIPDTLKSWLSWWRDVTLLVYQDSYDDSDRIPITNIDHKAFLQRMARTWNRKKVFACFKHTNLALWQLERNANTRLVLENLLLTYPFQSE